MSKRTNTLDLTLTSQSNVPADVTNELFNEAAMKLYNWIMLAVVCQSLDIFGISTNIINIICFVRQGFKDPVTVSLLGLAVSDLGCLTTLIWTNICFTPPFSESDLPFDPSEFQFIVSAIPHTTFTRITGWITALITLERCLCITMPLKVSSIITSRRVSIIIISVFIILLGSVAPVYVVNRLGAKFFPTRNKTLIGLTFTDDRASVEKVSFAINNTVIPTSSFLVIIICTLILVLKLRSQAQWRKTSTAAADNISKRNLKVAKMIVMISSLSIACCVPLLIIFAAMSTDSRFSINGEYKNALVVFGGVGLVLESINSSSNIFIYYYMSSNYRIVFRQLFSINKK